MENFKEMETEEMDQELENEAEVNDIPEETSKGNQETEPAKKPGKVKRFFKGAWKVTKKVLPLGAAYSLGYATKAVLGKVTGGQATTAGDVPAIPEMKTETIDLGNGVTVESKI